MDACSYYGLSPPATGPEWAAAAIVLVPVLLTLVLIDKGLFTSMLSTRMGITQVFYHYVHSVMNIIHEQRPPPLELALIS